MASPPRLDAYHFYEEEWGSYEELCETFEWAIPEQFNIAEYICDRHATDKGRVALFYRDQAGTEETYTFWQLRNRSNQLANYLRDAGIGRGDRVGITAPQKPATAITYLACWKLGAVVVPLSTLFGPDALGYRLDDAGAKVVVIDDASREAFEAVRSELDALQHVLTVDVPNPVTGVDFDAALAEAARAFDPVATAPDDDGHIFYTSGTTGPPKGVRHAHRQLLGVLPSFILWCLNNDINADDVFYSSATWAWAASMYIIWAPWFYGIPVVGYSGPFDPETDLDLLETYGVTNYFSAPTAIRQLMQIADVPEYDLDELRLIYSAAEEVTPGIIDWVAETFDDAVLGVAYGQTEALGQISECQALFTRKTGTLGKEVPGFDIGVVDPDTAEPITTPGEIGEIAMRYEGNPVYFKEFWNKPEKTADVRVDGWHLTGDLGSVDTDGFFSFVGRKDDVIISAGYRIGPEEVEDTIASHEAVADAGVIGLPDEERTEIPKAFVTLAPGNEPSTDLKAAIKTHVRENLAKYEYPREVEFIDELPTTVTGKVRRVDLREREGIE